MIAGSRTALEDPNAILLAASIAKALFGTTTTIGQTVIIDSGPALKVAGIYEDLPDNASLKQMKFMASWDFYVKRFNLIERTGWGIVGFRLLCKLRKIQIWLRYLRLSRKLN